MYDESILISQIKTSTGYTNVDYSVETTIDMIETDATLPRILVGHLGIRPEHPNQQYSNGYSELENPEILHTAIQFICLRTQLTTVRNAIKIAYTKFSPIDNPDYSSLIFLEANVIAKTNDKIWWQEIVGCIFPRIT
jgi:hypothetical protein